MRKRLKGTGRSTGFSLVENVVALVIVSAGLLGTTRLFSEALRSLRDDHQRQTAVLRGEALIENLLALRAWTLPAQFSCSVITERCFTDEFAHDQLVAWRAATLRTLPEARTLLTVTGSNMARTIRLQISWRESSGKIAKEQFERTVRK